MNEVIKSVSFDQIEILKGIQALYCPQGFDCDITYGNGKFYGDIAPPVLKFDIDPQADDVIEACSTALPLIDGCLNSVVFDPPFLTYVRAGREGNGKMIMANRFAGYWRYDELETHYKGTLVESRRILRKGGILIFKCQDIIHNHRMHCTHANVIKWAEDVGMRLVDLFILPAKHRLPSPNRGGAAKTRQNFPFLFFGI